MEAKTSSIRRYFHGDQEEGGGDQYYCRFCIGFAEAHHFQIHEKFKGRNYKVTHKALMSGLGGKNFYRPINPPNLFNMVGITYFDGETQSPIQNNIEKYINGDGNLVPKIIAGRVCWVKNELLEALNKIENFYNELGRIKQKYLDECIIRVTLQSDKKSKELCNLNLSCKNLDYNCQLPGSVDKQLKMNLVHFRKTHFAEGLYHYVLFA